MDYQMFIGGKWTGSRENERIPVYNPFNRELWATVPQASPDDVEQAVFAARRAFETVWKKSKGIDRAGLLMRLSELLRRNAERMAVLETKDNGKVIRETKVQMHFAARNYQFFAGYADKLYGEVIPLDNPHLFDYTLREPLGVVVLIISWNSPMTLLANKLAPALAAGNTVIIKPSEHASVTCLEMGKLIEEAGFPAGVVNIVTGDGTVGGLLISHPDIDKVSFTGGTETGKRIAQQAGRNLVPATLELGGKSPNIIFADADLDKAVIGALAGIFAASGQTCIAGSRLLVQRPVYDEVVERLAQKSRAIKLGNPLDAATEMGPVANRQQFEKILAMIEKAKQEGAKLVQGGVIPGNPELQQGYFITPTLFADVENSMGVAQEEIFGPVLSIIPFADEEEAVQIANGTSYGLASGVWTSDINRMFRMAREIKAGTVWVNTYRTSAAQAPFGGMKKSGYGRERGWHALLEYTAVKNVMIHFADDARDPFSIQTN